MPRQIIDTESSRPAYRRRLAVRWVIMLLLCLVAVAAGIRFWQASHPRSGVGRAAVPGKMARLLKPGTGSPHRRQYAA
jgi:hypothetical protein